MQPHLSKLTPEEQERNKHGQMCLYSYTDKNLESYEETSHFPKIISHAQMSLISRDDIFVPKEKLVRGLSPGFDINVYYPGFPKLQHIPHTASLTKAEVHLSALIRFSTAFHAGYTFAGESIPAAVAGRKYDSAYNGGTAAELGQTGVAIIGK